MLHIALDLLVRAAGSLPYFFSLLTSVESRQRTCDQDDELDASAVAHVADG